jgi:trimeric autotransporter adhesin
MSTAFGNSNTASSFGETTLGIGATTYTPTLNGATQYRTANATDRLFVVGNAIDTDADNILDTTERSDALVILKNGNTGIGTSTPSRRLHVATGVSGGVPNGNSDFILESNGPIYQHFLAPSTAETGLLFGSNAGSIRGGVLFNNVNEILQFRTGGNVNRMFITNLGDVGIGTGAPGGQFELSLNEGRKPGSSSWTIVSDKRLKTINGNYTKGLNEIIQLNPIKMLVNENLNKKY